jgi:hypothetical protein
VSTFIQGTFIQGKGDREYSETSSSNVDSKTFSLSRWILFKFFQFEDSEWDNPNPCRRDQEMELQEDFYGGGG